MIKVLFYIILPFLTMVFIVMLCIKQDVKPHANLRDHDPEVLKRTDVKPREILRDQEPLVHLRRTEKSEFIPKIIHQIWLGSKARPKSLMNHCRGVHEGWEYKLWTEDNLFALENQDTYDCSRKPHFKSDVLRYEILKRYGGFYLDADTLCLRPLDPLLNNSFVIGYHNYHNPGLNGTFRYNDRTVANGIIGTVKGGRIITKLVAELRNDVEACNKPAWKSVGPLYVTKVLKIMNFTNILPFWAFVPYHFTEAKSMGSYDKMIRYGSFAANLWGTTFMSWDKLKEFDLKKFHQHTSNVYVPCLKFKRRMTKDLIEKYTKIMKVWHSVLEDADIDYSIGFGTALGFKRHGGFIPWGDDFDIVVRREDSDRIIKLLKNPLCTFPFWGGFKLYECDSPKAGAYDWGYPFVDIFDGRSAKLHKKSLPSIMFPSRQIKMEGMSLRGPYDIDRHLHLRYNNIDECTSPHWDHKNEVGLKRETYLCKDVMKQCFN